MSTRGGSRREPEDHVAHGHGEANVPRSCGIATGDVSDGHDLQCCHFVESVHLGAHLSGHVGSEDRGVDPSGKSVGRQFSTSSSAAVSIISSSRMTNSSIRSSIRFP